MTMAEERKELYDKGMCEECHEIKQNRTWLLCNKCNTNKCDTRAPVGMSPNIAHH